MEWDFRIFAGTANDELADAVARALGVHLAASEVSRFPDGEITVELYEPVHRKEVFVIQPTSPPVSEHLVELLAFADACRRAAAARIVAVIPYFGYGRADRRHGRREPISAGMVADLLQAVGVDHVITVDLHAPQTEGFFRIPVDDLTAVPALHAAVRDRLPAGIVVVSPDPGRMRMAGDYAERLDAPVAVLHRRRGRGADAPVIRVVGDVRDRPCLLIDDIIATGSTLASAVEALLAAGARPEITIAATHALLLPGARQKLGHPAVREIHVTDTVAVDRTGWDRLHVVSVAPLLAGALRRFMADGAPGDLQA